MTAPRSVLVWIELHGVNMRSTVVAKCIKYVFSSFDMRQNAPYSESTARMFQLLIYYDPEKGLLRFCDMTLAIYNALL